MIIYTSIIIFFFSFYIIFFIFSTGKDAIIELCDPRDACEYNIVILKFVDSHRLGMMIWIPFFNYLVADWEERGIILEKKTEVDNMSNSWSESVKELFIIFWKSIYLWIHRRWLLVKCLVIEKNSYIWFIYACI